MLHAPVCPLRNRYDWFAACKGIILELAKRLAYIYADLSDKPAQLPQFTPLSAPITPKTIPISICQQI